MALYCEPKLRDFGLADHGWRGFGGIVSDLKTGEIPQYNLAAFWKRPIAPIVTGFAEPILRKRYIETVPRRPPGSLRADMDARALANINLLAATCRNGQELTFWTVTGDSASQSINEYVAEIQNGVLISEGKLQNQVVFDNPVIELRNSEINGGRLWTRCKKHLNLIDPSTAHKQCIFRGSVRNFEECELLPGDLALCDTSGMLWSGTIGSPLSRTKTTTNDLIALSYSDHPRTVFVASAYQVRSLDLRLSRANALELFDVPDLAKKGTTDHAFYVASESRERPLIYHLKSIPKYPHNFFVMTDHCAYLCDERFPKNTVLTLPHSIPYGAHMLQTCAPVSDSLGCGMVVSVYLLDHLLTGVWVSRLFHHNCGAWSSILPLHAFEDYVDFDRLVKPFADTLYRKRLPIPANGMAVIQGLKDAENRQVELLIRSLNNGEVYYQTMRYGGIEDAELKTFWKQSQRRVMSSGADREQIEIFSSPSTEDRQSTSLSITYSNEDFVKIYDKSAAKKAWNPLRKKVFKNCTPLEPLQPSSSKAVLPQIINDVWKEAMGME